jgi:mannitol/fructose-specific phosphotransferase system IIA component (Ntr-type)
MNSRLIRLSVSSLILGLFVLLSLVRGDAEDVAVYLILPATLALLTTINNDLLAGWVGNTSGFRLFQSTFGPFAGASVAGLLFLSLVLLSAVSAEALYAYAHLTLFPGSGPVYAWTGLGHTMVNSGSVSGRGQSVATMVLAYAPLILLFFSIRPFRSNPTDEERAPDSSTDINSGTIRFFVFTTLFYLLLLGLSWSSGLSLSSSATLSDVFDTVFSDITGIARQMSGVLILLLLVALLALSMRAAWFTFGDLMSEVSVTRTRNRRLSLFLTVTLTAVVVLWMDASVSSWVLLIETLVACVLLITFFVALATLVRKESGVDESILPEKIRAYPWVQFAALLLSVLLLFQMNSYSLLLVGTVMVAVPLLTGRGGVSIESRGGAIFHLFARWGEGQYDGLDRELRGILREKGLRDDDPFEQIVAQSRIFEVGTDESFNDVIETAAGFLHAETGLRSEEISRMFRDGTRIGATPVAHGIALPHFRIKGLKRPLLVMARSRNGISITSHDPLLDREETQKVHAIFFLVSDEDDPARHLRILAQIAERVDDDMFMQRWLAMPNAESVRDLLIQSHNHLNLTVQQNQRTGIMIGAAIRSLDFPPGILVAVVHRRGEMIIPSGGTVLESGDRITMIGSPEVLEQVRTEYSATQV